MLDDARLTSKAEKFSQFGFENENFTEILCIRRIENC